MKAGLSGHGLAAILHELDHRRLVDECGRMFDGRGILLRGLVQTAREPGAFGVFV